MTPDHINAAFEFGAALAILNQCRAVINAGEVKGISVLSIVFFTLWGGWNVYYYPHLGQDWSFLGGLFVLTANLLWIALLLYYGNFLSRITKSRLT